MFLEKLEREKELFKKRSIKTILAIDEVGRGALAGPLFVCGLLVDRASLRSLQKLPIRDSKKLTPEQRKIIFQEIKRLKIPFILEKTQAKKIDRINIGRAWLRSIDRLIKKTKPDFVLVDGVAKSDFPHFESWVKGDNRIISISAASIIAKHSRDTLMIRLGKKISLYAFEKHKGYGTKLHSELIRTYGLSIHHRKTFCKKIL